MQNYQIEMERELAEIRKSGLRPLLVLHACCAPCSSAVLEKLSEDFRIIVFFYNPNIAPEAEFVRRADEEERLVREMGLADVRVARGEYDAAAFYAAVRSVWRRRRAMPRRWARIISPRRCPFRR